MKLNTGDTARCPECGEECVECDVVIRVVRDSDGTFNLEVDE